MASRTDLLEIHGDSETSWTVTNRGRDLNIAIADAYVNSVEPPIRIIRYPPGTRSMNLAERGQKRLLVLAYLNLHHGRLSLLAWEEMFIAAEGQLDFHCMPQANSNSN